METLSSEQPRNNASDFKIHPLAFTGNKSGGGSVNAGQRFIYDLDGRHGRLDEALSDGTALVTWDDGTYGEIHWNQITLETPWKEKPRWSAAENDGRFSISDIRGLYGFEIITFMRRGKEARHLGREEKRRFADYIAAAINAYAKKTEVLQ